MTKKYEFTDETIRVLGRTLHRIKALRSFCDVKTGELGGFIEKEENLSHDGNAWVSDDARVFGVAQVSGDALVSDDAHVYGGALVYGYAHVSGYAQVYGGARVYGDALVSDGAQVSGGALVYGYAQVYGGANVYGYAHVYGGARVCGDARVFGNAQISGNDDYLCFNGLGSENRNTTFFKCNDGHIHVKCGCFNGTLAEFEEKVKETHGDRKYAKEYLACVQVVKIHFEIGEETHAAN